MGDQQQFDVVGYALAKKDVKNIVAGAVPNDSITDEQLISTGIKSTIANKIKTFTYSAPSNGITNITHGLNYDSSHDELEVIDEYYGAILTKGVHYTENTSTSILLSGWSLQQNEKIKFKLYKLIK